MDILTTGWDLDRERAEQAEDDAAETTHGGREPINWVQVAETMGTPNAVIVAGRLESEGIPTRVTQEAAGARVFAVTVGILGTARVWVPEELAVQAEEILSRDWDEEE